MERIDTLTGSFKTRLERFTIGCDSVEEISTWNKEEYGELDVYCFNEFVSVILRLIVADGNIGGKEVEYLNKNFDFSYSEDELKDIYENCRLEINKSFEDRLAGDVALIQSLNEKLAEEFKALIKLICEIISESDGAVSTEEKDELRRIEDAMNQRASVSG